MAESTTRRIVIEVDINGGQAALRTVSELSDATSDLTNQQNNNVRAQQTLGNANINSTRRFAEQQRGMTGLVKTYAITAANIFALSSAFNVLRENANLEIMIKSSQQLSKATGTDFGNVAKNLQNITSGALGLREAFQAATLGTAGGATVDQLNQITTIATKAAHALGRSVPDAVSRMVQAVTKAEPELVDEFGIILRMSEATDKYARSVGKAAKDLNTLEKQQALINQLIEQGTNKFKTVNLEATTNEYDKLAVAIQAIGNNVISVVSGPISSFSGFLSGNTDLLSAGLLLVATTIIGSVVPSFKEMGNSYVRESERIIESTQRATAEIVASQQRRTRILDGYRSITGAFSNAEQRINQTGIGAQLGLNEDPGTSRVFAEFADNFPAEEIRKKLQETTGFIDDIVVESSVGIITLSRRSAEELLDIYTNTRRLADDELAHLTTTWESLGHGLNIAVDSVSHGFNRVTQEVTQFRIHLSNMLGAVFNAETLSGSLQAFREQSAALDDFRDRQRINAEVTGESLGRLQTSWNTVSDAVVRGAGRVAIGIRALGVGINALSGPLTIIITAFELLVTAGNAWTSWLGVTTKKSKDAGTAISGLKGDYEDLYVSVEATTTTLMQQSTNMQELVDKYTLMGNSVRTVSAEVTKGLEAFKNVRGVDASFLTRSVRNTAFALGAGDSSGVEALDEVIKRVKLLSNIAGKPINLVINAQGADIDLANNLENANIALVNYINSAEGRVVIERKIRDEVEKLTKSTIEYEGAIKDLNTATSNLNKELADQYTQFIQNNTIYKQLLNVQSLSAGLRVATKEGKELEGVLTLISGLNPNTAGLLGFNSDSKKALEGVVKLQNTIVKLREESETPSTRHDILKEYVENSKEFLSMAPEVKAAIDNILGRTGFPGGGEIQISQLSEAALGVQRGMQESINNVLPKLDDMTQKLNDQLMSQVQITQQLEEYKASLENINDLQAKGVRTVVTEGGDTIPVLVQKFHIESEILELSRQQLRTKIEIDEINRVGLTDKFQIAGAKALIEKERAELAILDAQTIKYTDTVLQLTLQLDERNRALAEEQKIGLILQGELEKATSAFTNAQTQTNYDAVAAAKENIANQTIKQLKDELVINDLQVQLNKELGNQTEIVKLQTQQEKERNDLSKARLGIEQMSLEKIREEFDLANKLNDITFKRAANKDKALGIVSSIASNEDIDPFTRSNAQLAATKLMKENMAIEEQGLNTSIEILNKEIERLDVLAKTIPAIKETVEYKEKTVDIERVLLEKQALYLSNAERIYEQARRQHEIDKLLVDRGAKEFGSTFKDAMGFAAQDFAKSLGTSVDRVVKQVLGAIDATLDTVFTNIGSVIKGEKTGKEAAEAIASDLSNFFLESAMQNAKDNIKLLLLQSIGSEKAFLTPQEETNDWLEKIYNSVSGGAATAISAGNTPNLGSNMFTDIWAGIQEIPSIVGSAFDSIGNFFGGMTKFATGGIVSTSTIANVGEAGPEAVVPLVNGSIPVQVSSDSSQANINALIALGSSMNAVVSNTDEQVAAMKAWDISINTIGSKIISQLVIGSAQIVTAISTLQTSSAFSSGVNTLAVGLNALSSLIGAASSVYGSSGAGAGKGAGAGAGAPASAPVMSEAAMGGIFPGLRRMAVGGIVDRPELALIGEGRNNEAVIPMPNNRDIPVQFVDKNNNDMTSNGGVTVNVNVFGIRDEGGLNRSANQIALEAARGAQRALRRDG